MIKKLSNPCIRCGKERIQSKKWKEKTVTFSGTIIWINRTNNICPDKDCQKILDKELKAQKAKRDKIKSDREDRVKENLAKKEDLKSARLKAAAAA